MITFCEDGFRSTFVKDLWQKNKKNTYSKAKTMNEGEGKNKFKCSRFLLLLQQS